MKKLAVAVWAIVAVLAVLNLTVKSGPEPDVIYPMCNQHIEWNTVRK